MVLLCPFRIANLYDVTGAAGLVGDHSAHRDGVTDDVDHIQAAIDACYAAGGGIVYMPGGTYKLTALAGSAGGSGYNVRLKDKVYLKGDGQEVTLIKSGTANANAVFSFQARNVRVSHMTIWNNGTSADCIKLMCSSGVYVHNVTARDSSYSGIAELSCNDVTIQNCLVYNVATFGICVGDDGGGNQNPDGTYGLNSEVIDCEAYDCGNAGFRVYGVAARIQTNVTLTNCFAYDCQTEANPPWPRGFMITYTSNLTMTDCRAWNSNVYNVEVYNSATGTISNTGYKNPGGVAAYLHDNSPAVTETGAHVDS